MRQRAVLRHFCVPAFLATMLGLALTAGCGTSSAAEATVTPAQFDKNPCVIATDKELAAGASSEYKKWHLAPTGHPTRDDNACQFPIRSAKIGSDYISIAHLPAGRNAATTLQTCKKAAKPGTADHMVKVGDEGCVDDFAFVNFRVGHDYFVVMTMLPDSVDKPMTFEPLMIAAAKYLSGRVKASS